MNADVIVVGGGVSGLAAAVRLAARGASVHLVEQSPKLGGRCYSFTDAASGDVVDNGQHVLVGAYRHTLDYLETIGTRQYLRRESSTPFFAAGKGLRLLRTGALPAPFHLVAGVLGYGHLSMRERVGALRVGRALRRWGPDAESRLAGVSVGAWLDGLGQSDGAQRSLWNPFCVSVMNELPERASALLFARALRATFLGPARNAEILIPTIGQTELYVEPASRFLSGRGGRISAGVEAAGIELAGGAVAGVRLSDGTLLEARNVIAAVPPHALARLVPRAYAGRAPFAHLGEFASSPIVSVHLWFDREVLSPTFVGLLDRDVQWFFNRRRIVGPGSTPGYVSAVISAAYAYVDLPKEELVALAIRDLRALSADAVGGILVGSLVIKEKRATFSATGTADAMRPGTGTPIGGLYLAGDWTDTGYPATIEGAILSGNRAAAQVRQAAERS